MKVTVVCTYFRSLELANLAAALHSVRRQALERAQSIIVFDNDTAATEDELWSVIEPLDFPVPVRLVSMKHGDRLRAHSWSSNAAVREAAGEWLLFTRADYLLDFDLLRWFTDIVASKPVDWDGFVTANVYHLAADIAWCEQTPWRRQGTDVLRGLPGSEGAYTTIDAGVWMARKSSYERVGGLDEELTAWGHAQTHFQYKLHRSGVEFVRIPQPLFYHPMHAAERDIELTHRQLRDRGVNLREMWARYEGAQPY